MKKLVFALTLLAGFSVNAAQVPVFKCTVPVKATGTSPVTVEVAVSDSESVDYVTINLNDKTASNLFMQLQKDSFQKQVTAGSVTMLALEQNYSQGDDGVIRNAGVLGVTLDSGKWSGLLAVKSNVYPLECTKL